jgi:predicted KAP-like P-loop ATPase
MLSLLLLKGLFKFISINFIINLPLNRDPFIKTIYNLILIIINRYIKVFKCITYNKTVNAPELA